MTTAAYDIEAISILRSRMKPGDRILVFQNFNFCADDCGELIFQRIGPERLVKEMPDKLPGNEHFWLVGEVMEDGNIVGVSL